MSARSKLLVQRALLSSKHEDRNINLNLGESFEPAGPESFEEIMLAEDIPVRNQSFANQEYVESWLDAQQNETDELKTYHVLKNVTEIPLEKNHSELSSNSTKHFEIEKDGIFEKQNASGDDDDSVKDKNYVQPEGLTSDSESDVSSESRDSDEDNAERAPKTDTLMVGENNNHEKEEGQEIEGNLRREEDNIVNEEQKVNSRKRQRRPETWKRNIKKKKVNSGESYISEGKRVIQAKEMRKPCSDNCIHKCFNMETGSRKTIFSNFWGLSDNDLQRQFVVSHMQLLVPKYRRVIEGSNRGNNFAYYFTINGIRRRVCKTFFMNTLNIGDRLIRTSWKKSKDCAIIEKDKRGNTNSHQTVEESIKDSVRNHINSFHRIESHYLRAQTSREFIDGSLTLAQMYRFYKDDQEEKKQPYAKKCTYDTIFNTEFNISFFRPKKDQCSICESYKNGNEAEKRNRQEEYDRHVKNKVRSREEKQKDIAMGKENNNIIVSCFDLQAVLPTPCGDISTFFYKCRLNCLNFTIFEITSRNGFCYFWHEGIAMRGANEIATCLLDYLSSLPAGKDVIFYSDNCVGQNKNKIVISMYLYAINKTQLKSITHKFLTVGHTQNEGDSMHSVIEKAKKRMLRSGPIYVPSQWPPLIRAAKKEGKPYKVRELATDEFMDSKSMANGFGQKFSKNSENEKVVWNDIHVFRVEKDFPDTVFYKTDFDSDGYKKIDLSSRRSCNLSEFVLQEAYSTHPVLRDKTKEHLCKLPCAWPL